MGNFIILLILIILSRNFGIKGEILPCNNGPLSTVCFLEEDYVPTKSPKPLPTMIDITIEIIDIKEVDEEKQAVELSLKIILDWQDNRLSVNRSKEDFNK